LAYANKYKVLLKTKLRLKEKEYIIRVSAFSPEHKNIGRDKCFVENGFFSVDNSTKEGRRNLRERDTKGLTTHQYNTSWKRIG